MTYIGCEESEREREGGGGGGGRDSFRISKCLLGSVCASLWEGGKGKKKSKRGVR